MTRITPGESRKRQSFPFSVSSFAASDDGRVIAGIKGSGSRSEVVLESRLEALRSLLKASDSAVPTELTLCPDGCHLSVAVRTVEGREAHIFDTATGSRLRIVTGVGRTAVLISGCTLLAVDDSWPYAKVLEVPCAGGTMDSHTIDASVLALLEDASGPLVHCTRPDHPPSVVRLAELIDQAGSQDPPRHHAVTTRWGSLRVLTVPAADPVGDIVMLHGGPFGVWIPRWDPQMQLLTAHGYRVHQVEAPYTASLRRAHTRFVPGDFGSKDVESITDAVTALASQRPLLMYGFSYGGLLAARTSARLPGIVNGVFLQSALWRSQDLQRLIDDGVPAPGDLRSFLAHAFPGGQVHLPEVRLRAELPTAVVHGTDDLIAPVDLVEAACAAAPEIVLTRLPGEGHIPRRASSVVQALHAMKTWLQHCEGTLR
ncbi:S9 family peptidase [Streptomyces sp. RKAG293]|uniref:alpha/beta hydrolase family protein n=1 Tax=Streptomyces sp. RKAG293 TaxID=2893403 RepID=UPI002033DB44|nr:alpha/beta fold hydrolase [Streptomyces sp. RKAG293]MCM2420617.1 alpha/beta fold hydrolase [Streptomyces sp. RKAG293]